MPNFKAGDKVKWLCQLNCWGCNEKIKCIGKILKIYYTTMGGKVHKKVAQIVVSTPEYHRIARRKKTTISLDKLSYA